ncbi:MarR family winged helix-turn-helix transcriptional regulator [Actinomadura algeriensis]|uniref:DNA-binding MarR family transcriptional regulator n=1 Tax=Actinomadura algeriensis TaxID=1679523 RepID=A0ABR9K2D4_9ACTN|nr:MarR family transcriptional regulator [Actinomadura algeriensis]MBE1537025.1 DNA-binding MarR family transcriptional regulator [Actinomadura algeriensis]
MLLVVQGRMMSDAVEARLAPLGLALRTMGFLGHLARSPGISFTDLAARARITVQSTHTIAARLAEDGLIDAAGRTRGRAATLRLTEAGWLKLAEAEQAIAELDAERFGPDAAPAWQALAQALFTVARTELPAPPAS